MGSFPQLHLRIPTALLAGLLTTACANAAQAQGRGQSTPLGGRSTLLGGTGVAAGADAAVPLLNPAGILSVDAGLLAVSTRFVRLGIREYEQFRSAGTSADSTVPIDDPDVADVGFAALPSGTCYFASLKAGAEDDPARRTHKLSFCIYQSEVDKTTAEGGLTPFVAGGVRGNAATSVSSKWQRNHFGAGWATPLGKNAAIGLSTFLVATSLTRIDVAAAIGDEPSFGNSTYVHTLSGSNFQLVNSLGFTMRAGRYVRAGISVRAPGLTLYNSGETTTSLTTPNGPTLFESGEGSFVSSVPAQVAVGLAYSDEKFHCEVNGSFVFPGPFARFTPDADAIRIEGLGQAPVAALSREERARGRMNIALGAEYTFSDSFAMLAGASTNFSSLTPRNADAPNVLFPARRDGLLAATGIGVSGPLGKLLTGLRTEYLYGETLVPTTHGEHVLVDDDEWAVTVIFSGQVKVREALKAARDLLTGQ